MARVTITIDDDRGLTNEDSDLDVAFAFEPGLPPSGRRTPAQRLGVLIAGMLAEAGATDMKVNGEAV